MKPDIRYNPNVKENIMPHTLTIWYIKELIIMKRKK